MDIIEGSPTKAKWNEALRQMQSALDALDETEAPADIGSHLDLAICRLEHALGCDSADNSVQQLRAEIENALAASVDLPKTDRPLWSFQSETLQRPPVTG